MEFAATKPTKSSSNISEMVSKFANVCKVRYIGVFHNENPNQQSNHCINVSSVGVDGSDATEETECDDQKIHARPAAVSWKSNVCAEDYVLQLFDTVSAVKVGYIQLQEAHVPYNLDKIIAADEHIVAQLEALCKLKRIFKDRQFENDKRDSSHLDCLKAKIKVNERLLEKLKSLKGAKDDEIVNLRRELHNLDLGNAALVEIVRQKSWESRKVRVMNIGMFEDAFQKASKSIHDFAKPIISLMKASGWDLDLAANSIESGVFYSKRSHKKYAFEAYIARKMFYGISLKSYNVDDVMKFDDPIDSLIDNPNSGFANFSKKKYFFVVHPVMEMSFFGNLDQRMFLLSGKHPRTPFYQIFARMAKWVWVLQGIAKAIDSKAEIFAPRKGTKFSDVYMKSIETDDPNGGQSSLKVQFMVMPGFRIGDTLIRSRVYLSDIAR